MSFASWAFLLFLLAVYAGYRVLPRAARNPWLLVASYVFYGWVDVRFLFLLILTSVVYFYSGLLIHRGSLTVGERLRASSVVIGAAVVFVLPQWAGAMDAVSGLPAVTWEKLGGRTEARWILLAVCLLVVTANVTYSRIAALEGGARRRIALWVGIAANLGILAVFKYLNFFVENVEALLRSVGVAPSLLRLDLVLPIGISFYTFQGMTYVVDIYRKRLTPTPRLADFALFLGFFPLVMAGPIERATRLIPQITRDRALEWKGISRNLYLILQGFFKKAVIADGVGATASAVFGMTVPATWLDAVAGTICFALQLYCDFSGYSDIAVGVAGLFGIDVMANFRNPYFARDPADFWGRWHISLSSWFRDYVFFPLGGPYGKTLQWSRNVMLTFFATGLWHGAAWTYVIWGLYHGALLCLHRLGNALRKARPGTSGGILPAYLAIPGFLLLTCYGWIIFRCRSLQHVLEFSARLVPGMTESVLTAPPPEETTLLAIPMLLIIEFVGYRSGGKRLEDALPMPAWTACYAFMLFALILGAGAVTPQFVYFAF